MNSRTVLTTAVVCFAAASTDANDWPRFHGLAGNGTSPETGLVKEWAESGPPVVWETEVGPGFGGVAVRDGEVYLLDRELGEADIMRCFDLESGEELWSHRYEAPGRLQFAGSRTVPTVEEEYIYTLGGFGHLTCYSRESHEPEWSVSLIEDCDGDMPGFGYAQSPVVYEDLVIVAPLGEEVGLLALDRFTGDEVWRTESMGSTHSCPTLVELHGEQQLLIGTAPGRSGRGSGGGRDGGGGIPGGGRPGGGQEGGPPGGGFQRPETTLTSLDPETGELLWQGAVGSTTSIVAPLKVSDSRFFLTGESSVLVEVVQEGDEVKVNKVAEVASGSKLHLPMVHDGHMYFIAGGDGAGGGRRGRGGSGDGEPRERGASGKLVCLDADGNEKWNSEETIKYGSGNVLLADGVLYIQDGYSGSLRVVKPTPDGYQQIAEADLFNTKDATSDQQAWAPMALSNGHLLIRTQDQLKCVDLRSEK